jgi:hypothetical protein
MNAHIGLLQKPKGRRPSRRWKDNIEMDLGIWIGLIWFYKGTSGGLL